MLPSVGLSVANPALKPNIEAPGLIVYLKIGSSAPPGPNPVSVAVTTSCWVEVLTRLSVGLTGPLKVLLFIGPVPVKNVCRKKLEGKFCRTAALFGMPTVMSEVTVA